VSTVSPYAADVDAFMAAEREFTERFGEEAQRRWSALGASSGPALEEQQATVIKHVGAAPRIWEALEWEVKCKIELLTQARREARARESAR
jgi:hypothetical protein